MSIVQFLCQRADNESDKIKVGLKEILFCGAEENRFYVSDLRTAEEIPVWWVLKSHALSLHCLEWKQVLSVRWQRAFGHKPFPEVEEPGDAVIQVNFFLTVWNSCKQPLLCHNSLPGLSFFSSLMCSGPHQPAWPDRSMLRDPYVNQKYPWNDTWEEALPEVAAWNNTHCKMPGVLPQKTALETET